MEFQVLILVAPIEDKIIFAQKVWNSRLTFIKLSENPQDPLDIPIEGKLFLAKKVWNSKLTFIQLSENPQEP